MVVLLGAKGETGGTGGAVLATSVSAGVVGLHDILALADVALEPRASVPSRSDRPFQKM